MDIRTLEVAEYRGCKLYIRNFNTTFEYLAVIDGELYTAHMIVTKSPLRALLRQDYTKKQLEDVVKYLKNIAEATVDHVLEGKN